MRYDIINLSCLGIIVGALACNLSRGATLEESIRNALTCASESVTRKGAQTSYSSLSQLDENYRPPSLTENKLFSIEDILDNISE